jgi:periplasmic protein CpxP/Spy
MKRILLPAALVLALSGGFAFAQAPQPPAQQAPAPIERHYDGQRGHRNQDPQRAAAFLSKKLNLSADQTAKIEPILADRNQKIAALKADNSQSDPKALRKQFHEIQKSTQEQLAGVLTPDQLQQMKAMRRGPHGHRGPAPAGTTPTA